MGTLSKSEGPDEKPHYVTFHQVCQDKYISSEKEMQIYLKFNYLSPYDIYNKHSQVYCIKPQEESISI